MRVPRFLGSAVLFCALAVVVWDYTDLGVASHKACKRFCVTVDPRKGDSQTVFTFSGWGWRPKERVTPLWGVYAGSRKSLLSHVSPWA
jgi:hypothetical protein